MVHSLLANILIFTTFICLMNLLSGIMFNAPCSADLVMIAERMATVKDKILILSGKGGVG